MPVYLLGTLDTKGPEIDFARQLLEHNGLPVVVVDTGCLGDPGCPASISRADVFAAAGVQLADVQAAGDRGQAVSLAARGAAEIVASAFEAGNCDAVLSLGGSAGTTIGTAAMKRLPLGVPKVMVSTLASGQTRPYVGAKDIFMMNSVVDVAGINRISRVIIDQAVAAITGLVRHRLAEPDRSIANQPDADRPLIAASMFGVTTPCVQTAREVLEQAGFEVLVFHATGNGGQAMESLIDEGLIAGVLDITTTELADELVGGVLSAGPERLMAAGRRGVPQVISVGALDMVNFGPPESIPDAFRQRTFYHHNPTVTLMRTTADENRKLGHLIAQRTNMATGPARILLPLRGVSAIDQEGQPFDDPDARQALFDAIRDHTRPDRVEELDAHINDVEFAERAARLLLELIGPRTVN